MSDLGYLSLLPPCAAVFLAITTRRVVLSLLGGLAAASVLIAMQMQSFSSALLMIIPNTFSLIAGHSADEALGLRGMGVLRNADRVLVVIVVLLLGAFTSVLESSGGAAAFGRVIATRIRGKRDAQLAAAVMGCSLFTSAYFSALATGAVFRPIFDRLKISRAKLAFIVDATAAPINTLVPVSGWIAYMIVLMHDNFPDNPDGFPILLQTIPFNLYAWAILLFVFLNAAGWLPDFGPMRRAENLENGTSENHQAKELSEEVSDQNASAWNMILPLGVSLVILIVLGLWNYTLASPAFGWGWQKIPLGGNQILILAFTLGIFVSAMMVLLPRRLTLAQFMDSLVDGCRKTIMGAVIIILAITIGDLCRANAPEGLGTANFLGQLLGGRVPVVLLPAICFLLAAVTSFSTGTSWGTWGILMPLAIPLGTIGDANLFLIAGSIISGGCFGDHCSPISDTTVMSSLGADVKHTDHVNTQLPYALSTGAVCLVLFVLLGSLL